MPRPDCWWDCFKTCNDEIYEKMQGPSEFTIGGVLEYWDITDQLPMLRVPAVCIRGEYDTMTEECCRAIVNAIPDCYLVTIPRASHCKLLEEPDVVLGPRAGLHSPHH